MSSFTGLRVNSCFGCLHLSMLAFIVGLLSETDWCLDAQPLSPGTTGRSVLSWLPPPALTGFYLVEYADQKSRVVSYLSGMDTLAAVPSMFMACSGCSSSSSHLRFRFHSGWDSNHCYHGPAHYYFGRRRRSSSRSIIPAYGSRPWAPIADCRSAGGCQPSCKAILAVMDCRETAALPTLGSATGLPLQPMSSSRTWPCSRQKGSISKEAYAATGTAIILLVLAPTAYRATHVA